MLEQVVRVECYSGYKADQRPLRLNLTDGAREIVAIEDRWYSPGATYFRVLVEDGDRYLLRHEEAQDVWSLAGYRAAVVGQFPVSPSFVRNRQAPNGASHKADSYGTPSNSSHATFATKIRVFTSNSVYATLCQSGTCGWEN
jgi:hypothetical protein